MRHRLGPGDALVRFPSCPARVVRASFKPCLAAALMCPAWDASLAATNPAADHAPTPRSAALSPSDAERIGAYATALFREAQPDTDRLPPAFAGPPAVVYAAARASGERLASTWQAAPTGDAALRAAIAAIQRALKPSDRTNVNALELDLAYAFTPLDPKEDAARLSQVHRGLRGIQLVRHQTAYRFAPTEMIALNLSFERALERLAERAGAEHWEPGTPDATLSLFEADQLLVDLSRPAAATTVLYRGNTLVPIESVTRAAVERLRDALAQWMVANLHPDGRMTYLYWPSRGEESPSNNEIRQWMATVALTRLAQCRHDAALLDRTIQNIQFNLRRSYREVPPNHGLIVEGDSDPKVKLGALALACLALVEHPERARFAAEEAALRRTIDALWQPNGEFRTFWQPPERTDQVNFYPGEALLLWATLAGQTGDPVLHERILTSLRFYRTWHRNQPNPAFIPWHTQAYFLLWLETRSAEVRDWIFEMNDWLLAVQQWERQAAFPDTMGRFYDPDRPFGPPHASSTGVYLEGLIDAWRLAQDTHDAARQERYRQSIVRGLRSVMQLAFLDDVDLFYVSKRARVFGGVRTTVYDNAIRVDNVQHNLMAILKILEHLPTQDFRP